MRRSLKHCRHTNNCYITRSAGFTYSTHRLFRYESLAHKLLLPALNFFFSCGDTTTGKIWTSQIQLGLHIYVKGVGYCGKPPAALHQGISHAFWWETTVNINNSSFRLRLLRARNLGWCNYAFFGTGGYGRITFSLEPLKIQAVCYSETSVSTATKTSYITETFYRVSLFEGAHCTLVDWYQGSGRTSWLV